MPALTLDPSPCSALEKAKSILLQYGRNSLAWKILEPGMRLWFAEHQDCVIGYQLYKGTRVVAGAPAARPETLSAVIQEFEVEADSRGEKVCYFGAETWLEDILRQSSAHKAVLLGAQPVWNPQHWGAALSERASLRELVSSAVRRGVIVKEVMLQDILLDPEYQECFEEWTGKRRMPELGFLLGEKCHPECDGRRIFTAFMNGKVMAYAVAAPVPARGGWIIDRVVRRRKMARGTSELLIHEMMIRFAREGAVYATLGLAPLSLRAGLSYQLNPGWMRAFFRWLYFKGAKFYSFDGLDFFKAKFNPQKWEPVYAIVNRPRFSFRTLYHVAGVFCRMPPLFFFFTALSRNFLEFLE